MNLIRKTLAVLSALALSLGFALPAAALTGYGTVDSATQGTVNVGGTGTSGSANAGLDVSVGIGASGTTSGSGSAQSSADANASAQASGNADVQVAPLLITRVDIDAGTVKATVSTPSNVQTRADLSGYVAGQMKADTNISSVAATSESVAVTYKQHAKLFGFIPVTVSATASVDAAGNVDVSYPWWTFLAVTNKDELQAKIQDRVDAAFAADASLNANVHANAGKNGVVSGNASATGTAQANANAAVEAAAKLTAAAQARLVQEVKAVMQAELDAATNANAEASAAANAGGTVNAQ